MFFIPIESGPWSGSSAVLGRLQCRARSKLSIKLRWRNDLLRLNPPPTLPTPTQSDRSRKGGRERERERERRSNLRWCDEYIREEADREGRRRGRRRRRELRNSSDFPAVANKRVGVLKTVILPPSPFSSRGSSPPSCSPHLTPRWSPSSQ